MATDGRNFKYYEVTLCEILNVTLMFPGPEGTHRGGEEESSTERNGDGRLLVAKIIL